MRRALRKFLISLRERKSRLTFAFLRISSILLWLAPRRVAFGFIVLLTAFKLPGKTVLAKAFYPVVVNYLYRNLGCSFSSSISRFFPLAEVQVLRLAGAYEELCERTMDSAVHMTRPQAAYEYAFALFELGDFRHAKEILDTYLAPSQLTFDADAAHFSALLDLLAEDIPNAVVKLNIARKTLPDVVRPHQNMAARYISPYVPTTLDMAAGNWGRIYSAANFLGQRVTHVGQGQLGPKMYALAFEAQAHLKKQPVSLSPKMMELLAELDSSYDDLKVLPEEWTTQIGHLGMLDMLFRMRRLGWWDGKTVLLTRKKLVANHAMLRLYDKETTLLTLGMDTDKRVSAELTSLEFWKAMSFNAFTLPDGSVVPWQEAGAKMMQIWEGEERGYPVRDEFDRQLGNSESLRDSARRMKERVGIPADAWYVCLHVRDSSHYSELPGTGQTHRNADIKNYLKAIEYITRQGGWVIKLGGPRSPKLPKMPRVFDYTRSRYRSDLMDMFLIRNSRFFIGTTSGLTNVAVSLGVPCALVNCITTDAQLWGERVRFALKWIKLRDGSLVSQRGVSTAPWRWRVFSAEHVWRNGAVLEENSPEEILETVKEIEALALGHSEDYLASVNGAEETLERWKSSLPVPYYYGNARPSIHCAGKYPNFLTTN